MSGWINMPVACEGLAPNTCQQCVASNDPAGCLECTNNSQLPQPLLLEPILAATSEPPVVDGCANCANSKQPETCLVRLLESSVCSVCRLEQRIPGTQLLSGAHAQYPCDSCTDTYGGCWCA